MPIVMPCLINVEKIFAGDLLLQIYKPQKSALETLDTVEKGCWINLEEPTDDEINRILTETQVLPEFLKYPLDMEETSRVESDEGQLLIIVKIPHPEHVEDVVRYETIPLGIVLLEDLVITVCPVKSAVLDKVVETATKQRALSSHIRFIFNIFLRVAGEYLRYLRLIDRLMDEYEEELHRSMRNKELIKLLNLEKSLVYFNTSLKANDMVMARLGSGRYLAITEDDEDILEDAQIENQQAIEMAKIYSDILAGMMDAYASVISNNLNIVMKFLTAVTIVLMLPNLVASIYGMNIELPFQHNPHAFFITMGLSFLMSAVVVYIFIRKKMF